MTAVRRVLLLLLALVAGEAGAQTFPKFTGLVVDAAGVLPADVERDLSAKLETLQRDTKRQLVVATIPDLQGYLLEDYGYRLGREWGVGLRDVNNGVVLFIAPNEGTGRRGPRIEVGYGLEGIVTDAFAGTIIRERMLPRLRAGDVPGGMTAGADALIQQLSSSPEEAKARLETAEREFDRTHRRETRQAGGGAGGGGALIFWVVVFLFVVLPLLRRRGGRGRRYHGGGDPTLPIVLWSVANELGRSRGGWSGGGGFGGGFGGGGSDGSWGGGGFTGGGGGSFGGGGASGDW